MFVLCVKTKGTNQYNQDKETSMEKVQRENKRSNSREGRRIPVGARFSNPVQTDPGAHQATCTMAIGSFQKVKRPGRGVNHPPSSSAEVKERVELYLHSPSSTSMGCSGANFAFYTFLL
jgi:hypothetical protein